MLEKVAMVSHGGRCRGVALKANAARDAPRFGLSNITTGVHIRSMFRCSGVSKKRSRRSFMQLGNDDGREP